MLELVFRPVVMAELEELEQSMDVLVGTVRHGIILRVDRLAQMEVEAEIITATAEREDLAPIRANHVNLLAVIMETVVLLLFLIKVLCY